ncbi:MAG TPA: iron-containing alcohol dehydrogenase family protein [Alphaproteobacteria bacterium]|jgi:alcohol dehydrogenase class IV|nr:iron-containing alcohol dehydrogenase family protein [Alphaproteobacteria bacterium]MDP6269020.1 iron-containing alcohol dehydrogenase family protein [Alphaproteobacteria bacterium]MDP7426833.1 iron-containing alcohol dehydrogenase family protein [Alphaproteobacteria bacterium]HJM48760.1 iron-containing alcohol dehydrogenase family protein [Alphaproteobacteria bacterium]
MPTLEVRYWPKRLCIGPGSLAELPELMAGLRRQRALVVCGRTVAGGNMLASVRRDLGAGLAGIFSGVEAHTPLAVVEAGLAAARECQADTLISVGGGSTIDAAKGIAILDASGGDLAPYQVARGEGGAAERPELEGDSLVHIAVPTTAGSASEAMPTAGIRDPKAGRKLLFWDDHLVPAAVILDPEMAVHAGPELSAASGMTALARCLEGLYSRDRQAISTGLSLHAAKLLVEALPRSITAPDNLEARQACQLAALMSGVASINAMASVVHAIGHGVGGRYGLQHGISHALLLPPAVRLLLPAVGADGGLVAAALGGVGDDPAEAAAGAIEALLDKLPLPRRLRDVGVAQDEIAELAAGTMDDYMMDYAPRPVTEPEIAALLAAVW